MVELNLKITDRGVDFEIAGSDLVIDYGLVSTIHAMLFTDARVDESKLQSGEDPRGYCLDTAGDRRGSKLWLLERSKRTNETLALARQYAQEALAPLVTRGIASAVAVEAEYGTNVDLVLRVTVSRSSDQRWSDVWKAQGNQTITVGPTSVHLLFR